jgi:hypothetical protein
MGLYVFSYAPFLRYKFGEDSTLPPNVFVCWSTEYLMKNSHSAYKPVEWLIDLTPLKAPLTVWADLWNVRSKFEIDISGREFDRRIGRSFW